ncbi:hypothetical protein J3E68DRAFT_420563 [Trichoderma sp. SZMC 28012]
MRHSWRLRKTNGRCKGEETTREPRVGPCVTWKPQEVQTKQGVSISLILFFIFASCLAFALHCVLQLLPKTWPSREEMWRAHAHFLLHCLLTVLVFLWLGLVALFIGFYLVSSLSSCASNHIFLLLHFAHQ